MYKKVLLISPEPYRENSTSRCLATFFSGWDPNKIAQIYTTNILPENNFCENYFRITDSDILDFILHRTKTAGKKVENIQNKSMTTNLVKNDINVNKNIVMKVKKLFKSKSPLYNLSRMTLWGYRWESLEFYMWLDTFKPDLIFLDLGQDNIFARMAFVIANKYKIPIITFLPDDFYFKINNSKLPTNLLYSKIFKDTTEKIVKRSSYNIFSCDMMRDKYCKTFNCVGDVIYFTSKIQVDLKICRENTLVYIGSFEYSRWNALVEIGNALQSISKDLFIDVYGKSQNEKIKASLSMCKGIRYHGQIPYSEAVCIMKKTLLVVHVEDFLEKNKNFTRYSLSTKIADCLSCGACMFAYGPRDVGSIDYLIKNKVAFVCTEKSKLKQSLIEILNNHELRAKYVSNALSIASKNHRTSTNQEKMKKIIRKTMK